MIKPDKWVILLALTSNPGSHDFQLITSGGDDKYYLFEQVIKKSLKWTTDEQLMYVVGATRTDYLERVRALAPDHFLLVPGVGAQGGNLAEISRLGMNKQCGLLVNAARNIIYAGSGPDFAQKARQEAQRLQQEMADYLEKYLPV